jgi:oligopeptide transport system permease protein
MTKYIIKRTIIVFLTLILISTITFFLMNIVPGGPFLSEKAPTPEVLQMLEAKYGLDKPLIVQYKNYMLDLAHGDLGVSLKKKGREITDIILEKFPVSGKLGLVAVFIAIFFGIPIGAIAALNRGKWLDNLLMFIATLGIAVPGFVVATSLMIIFGVKLHLLPTFGLSTPLHFILPAFTLAFYPMSYMARLMRSSMLEVLSLDYIRTAKAKGVSQFKMIFKHALRNSLIPVITYLGPLMAYILTGSFVVEKIFTIPGLGGEFINSITNRDYPMIMGTTIFLATILIFMNFFVDILYKVVDPRVNLDKE